jgi:hypothetical protein
MQYNWVVIAPNDTSAAGKKQRTSQRINPKQPELLFTIAFSAREKRKSQYSTPAQIMTIRPCNS